MSEPKTYKNAICLPCTGCEDKPLYPNAKGGVFDSNRSPIPHAFLRREYRRDIEYIDGKWDRRTGQTIKHHPLIVPGDIKETKKRLEGRYIFAGYLFPHYGHFLLESLANLWFFKQHPETPIIWLGVHNQPALNRMNESFIELYGITNPIHILTEQTVVEELIVPEPGYLIHTRYTNEQVQALKLVDAPDVQKGKKIWLSRSKLSEGLILNEGQLEIILEKNGWMIYHPEEYPIPDQVDMLKDAEVIAGIEGSAFHQLMLFPDYKGKVIIFARRAKIEFDFVHIAETLGLDQTIFYPPAVIWSHGLMHWAYNRFWLRLTPILDALGETRGTKKPALPKNNLPRLVSSLTDYFKHRLVLELWGKETTIAPAVKGGRTLCVSPDITFDTHTLPENTDYLDITADQLFTGQVLKAAPDLYCFRHRSDEQTLIRAFNNSLHLAKSTTMWLIEYDASERETMPEATLTEEERNNTANKKLVQYIASCHPMLTIIRLRGSNAALVWQQPRQMMAPSLSTFNQLSDLKEFDQCPVLSLSAAAQAFNKTMTIKTS